MAPIDLPKHKPDFVRPQTQDGLPGSLEPGHTLADRPHTHTIEPTMTVPKPQDNRMPSNMPPKLNNTEGIIVKRAEEPLVRALYNLAWDTSVNVVEGVMILFDVGPEGGRNRRKRAEGIVDPTLPDVADAFEGNSVGLGSDFQATTPKRGRITRQCTHGGAHCKARMRGHGGRQRQPNAAEKAIDDALERRDQSQSVLSKGTWEAACQSPTLENARLCQGMVVQPRAGGSAGAGIAAAAAIGAATAGHSAQGSLDILRDESSAYHWLLNALAVFVSLLLVVVVYRSAKKIRRQRAEGAQTARAAAGGAADADAVVIELQPMDKNGRGNGNSKC